MAVKELFMVCFWIVCADAGHEFFSSTGYCFSSISIIYVLFSFLIIVWSLFLNVFTLLLQGDRKPLFSCLFIKNEQ